MQSDHRTLDDHAGTRVTSFRILHIDSDPLERDFVALTLGLFSTFRVSSSAGGDEALAMATDLVPDLIICNATLVGIKAPTLLARLRQSACMAHTPIVITTTNSLELEQFTSLGIVGKLSKPFDPSQFVDTVRGHLRDIKFATAMRGFVQRMRTDAVALAAFRERLQIDPGSLDVLDGLQSCAHKLAGIAGIFGFQLASCTASNLEEDIIERRAGRGTPGTVESNIDALIEISNASDCGDRYGAPSWLQNAEDADSR